MRRCLERLAQACERAVGGAALDEREQGAQALQRLSDLVHPVIERPLRRLRQQLEGGVDPRAEQALDAAGERFAALEEEGQALRFWRGRALAASVIEQVFQ